MAKINLRAYNREIEDLIDKGQAEQAIAHCRYILKQYPKHVDTYRLLGKTYLESQRYTEAADIFQRVLAVVPDDFVAQLGMSIIREDEGNLEAALWHMERAFEVQPSNSAIQDELRRLYGRRDGVEPPRVRLTRGALVRMYFRGELYAQAIAEARAALAEDPTRLDVDIMLARTYYQSGQKVEATEVATRLVRKLPYCMEATRILAEVLPGTQRADDAKTYQQSLVGLDPYYAHVNKAMPTVEQIPDQAIMVEHLDWVPGDMDTRQPEWASSVGVSIDDEAANVPDWLGSLQTGNDEPGQGSTPVAGLPAQTAPSSPVDSVIPADDTEPESGVIPDWMTSAGWAVRPEGITEEAPVSAVSDEEEELEPNLAPADIPDWLQSMAPTSLPEEVDDAERLNLLDQILPERNEQPETPAQPLQAPDEPTEISSPVSPDESSSALPKWMSSDQPSQDEQLPSFDLPDWIQPEAENETTSNETSSAPTEDTPLDQSQRELPEWLSPETPEPQAAIDENIPSWLTPTADTDSQANVPEWFDQEPKPEEQAPVTPASSSEPIITPPTEELPSWLAALEDESSETGAGSEPMPDWLRELADDDEPAQSQAAPVESTSSEPAETTPPPASERLPEWLEGFPDTGQIDLYQETRQVSTHELESSIQSPQSPQSQQTPETPAAGNGEDIDAAVAWLESLAERQGAEQETLVTDPAERTEHPPRWVEEQAEQTQTAEPGGEIPQPVQQISPDALTVPIQSIQEPEVDIPEPEPLPDWLDSMEPTVPVNTVPEQKPETMEPEPVAPVHVQPPVAGNEDTVEDSTNGAPVDISDQTFAWLEALAARQRATEGLLTEPETRDEETPDWIASAGSMESGEPQESAQPDVPSQQESPAPEAEESSLPTPDEQELPDWMGEESSPPVSAQPEDVTEPASSETALPSWLQASEQEIEPEPEIIPESPPPASEQALPAWLQAIADEEGEPVSDEPQSTTDIPTWMQDSEEDQGDEQSAAGDEETRDSALPEWLRQVSIEEDIPDSESTPEETPVVADTQPVQWVPESSLSETQPVTGEFAVNDEETQPITGGMETLDEETMPVDASHDEASEVTGQINIPDEEVPQVEEVASPVQEPSMSAYGEPEAAQIEEVGLETDSPSSEPEPVQEQPVQEAETPVMEQAVQEAEDQTPPEPMPEPVQTTPSSDESLDPYELLKRARQAMESRDLITAIEIYNRLIDMGYELEEIILDLRNALYRDPVDIGLWQSLGDAYLRSNRIQDALNSYTKAEELLR